MREGIEDAAVDFDATDSSTHDGDNRDNDGVAYADGYGTAAANNGGTATATFSDATTQNVTTNAVWSSSDESKATISNASGSQGLAQGVAVGESNIGATYQGESASTKLTVTAATLSKIEVSPVAQSIPAGQTQQYTATGTYSDGSTQNLTGSVTWSSSNTAVIDISNASSSKGRASLRPAVRAAELQSTTKAVS